MKKRYQSNVWQYDSPFGRADFLCHYASPYYDPVKAHEYYMKNRELKGRSTSTAGLNSEGKIAASYVKNQITTEHKEKQKELQSSYESQMSSHKREMQKQMATLRAKLMGMNKEERARNKSAFKREINALRAKNNAERKRLTALLRTESKSMAEEYNNKYADELEAMGKDSGFVKTKKSKSKK